jgi:hypothetical protein
MHPWWTVELTAEKAKAHVQRWSREGGTHYIMWWSLSVNKEPWLYDVAIFWVPQENDVQAPNPVNPPWADLS